jgi:hypothetical protein
MNLNFEKIAVSPAIRECIARGASLGVHGGTTDTRKSVGHLKLTYAAKRLFGIARLPTHPERFANTDDVLYKDLAAALEEITPEVWTTLIADLDVAYRQLQIALAADYPDGFIPMQRRIQLIGYQNYNGLTFPHKPEELTYGKHLAIVALKAQAEGLDHIQFDADVLTGWCSREPGAYGEILVRRNVPIADVLLAQRYLASSGLESDEWLVLNREPSGILRVDPQSVSMELTPAILATLGQQADSLSWDNLRAYQWNTHRGHRRMPLRPLPYWSMSLDTRSDDHPEKRLPWWRRRSDVKAARNG